MGYNGDGITKKFTPPGRDSFGMADSGNMRGTSMYLINIEIWCMGSSNAQEKIAAFYHHIE